ncbi:amidophosphoribosyltransferase-like, partial [Arctopsyche grandis]|uniref:amidophosphoribosyltransferase-like n=1 Tax=Arctopsyche grandis TaxID=121162 RepID=UPI00406D6A1B
NNEGVGLSTHSDSELITQALCVSPAEEGGLNGPNWPARIRNLMRLAPLSYSLVIMLKDRIYGVRDPYGNRPLCLGRILPMGQSSGSDGWSGIPFVEVLCKNRYVGRTFIQPSTRLRQLGVAKKFGALSANVAGERLVLIDDSIVRGNTIGPIIKLLRDAGAKEVHVRIASPPLQYPCYMGINIPTREELIANKMSPEKLAKHVGADSLKYLSVEGLVSAVRYHMKVPGGGAGGHCTACLTGDYPGGLPDNLEW